ncbi:MAG: glycosyltransferase [Cyanobacteria bacterium P01_G01_bin.39]
MNQTSIAIFVWGLEGKAIANNAAAMSQGFKDLGIEQVWLVYLFKGPGKNVAVPPGVTLVPLGIRRSFLAPLFLAQFLRKEKPDVLISMPTVVNIPAIMGWLLARSRSTKLILSEHSTMSYKAYVEYKQDLRMRLMPWLARIFYPLADGLRANSQQVLDDLLNNIKIPIKSDSATTITNPVNIEAIAKCGAVKPSHPWLVNKDKPVILSVARLAKQKNFPLLIQAFAIVRQKIDARLIIVGDGPEQENLTNLVSQLDLEESVSLAGFSNNPWSYMATSDVFALASEEEPFGLVLVEAMACNLPIVATDALSGGPRTILESGKHGLLVANQDTEALADSLIQILTDDNLRDRLIKAGKTRCQTYQPKIIAKEWLLFINSLDKN